MRGEGVHAGWHFLSILQMYGVLTKNGYKWGTEAGNKILGFGKGAV